ncbi:protein of unknown function DUF3447 - like 8 [Theobroma cacao]|nr:protein of unknown function DUF3447 - like 8 [Theobroma cacao]
MYLRPSFARKLNQGVFSPIHLALQQGHTSTVLRLLDVDKDLVRIKGKQGYTAFHYVVQNENLELLAQFLKDCPACIEDETIQKKTALHIAAEKHRFEALEILVRWLERTHLHGEVSRKHLLNAKDTDGNTLATGSGIIAILAEVLTELLTRFFYYAWRTIRPADDIYIQQGSR